MTAEEFNAANPVGTKVSWQLLGKLVETETTSRAWNDSTGIAVVGLRGFISLANINRVKVIN